MSFRAAVEAKDADAIVALLHPDVEFHSPVTVKPYRGRGEVGVLLRILLDLFEGFHYVGALEGGLRDERAEVLVFRARVRGTAVQGIDLLTYDADGLVTDFTVMVRPLAAAMTLGRAVMERIGAASQGTAM